MQNHGEFLRLPAMARYLGISARTLRAWTARRIIPVYRPTRRCLLYRTGDIEATLMRFRTGPKNGGAA